MGPRVPFALLPLGIYLSNKVFKTNSYYLYEKHLVMHTQHVFVSPTHYMFFLSIFKGQFYKLFDLLNI